MSWDPKAKSIFYFNPLDQTYNTPANGLIQVRVSNKISQKDLPNIITRLGNEMALRCILTINHNYIIGHAHHTWHEHACEYHLSQADVAECEKLIKQLDTRKLKDCSIEATNQFPIYNWEEALKILAVVKAAIQKS